jgi:MFS family permease
MKKQTAPFWTPRTSLLILLWIAILFYCLDFFFRISPSLIFSNLMTQYRTDALGMGAFSSAFYLGYVLFQVPTGIWLDRYRLRWVLAVSIFISVVSFMFFITETHYWLGYAMRFITGAASAFSFIGILFIAKQYFPPHYFTLIAGITIGAGTVTASFIQLLSAGLMQYFHWQLVFLVFSAFGLIMFVLVLCLPKKMAHEHSLTHTLFSFKQLWCFTRNTKLILNACIGGLFYLPTTLFTTMWGVPFLQAENHFSLTTVSLGITFLFAGWAVGSPIMGYIADRTEHYFVLILIGSAAALISSIFLIYYPITTAFHLDTLLFLFGLFSSTQVVVWKIFNVYCPAEISGYGAAFTNMLIMLFGGIFHLIVGFLMQTHFIGKLDGEINYVQGLSIIPIAFLTVLGCSVYCMISSRQSRKNAG